MITNDLFYIEDQTKFEDENYRGWWVMMKEPEGAMIIFTGLRKEIAEQFKNRFEKAINGNLDRT